MPSHPKEPGPCRQTAVRQPPSRRDPSSLQGCELLLHLLPEQERPLIPHPSLGGRVRTPAPPCTSCETGHKTLRFGAQFPYLVGLGKWCPPHGCAGRTEGENGRSSDWCSVGWARRSWTPPSPFPECSRSQHALQPPHGWGAMVVSELRRPQAYRSGDWDRREEATGWVLATRSRRQCPEAPGPCWQVSSVGALGTTARQVQVPVLWRA